MIIFNLWAIPVGIVIVLVLHGLELVWPSINTPLSGWVSGLVMIGVGGAVECVGIKPRLFFMPIWLIGVGIVAYNLGVAGTIAFLVLLVGGAIWIHRKTRKQEAATWQKFCGMGNPAAPKVGADEAVFWAWVKDSLFLPVCTDYTPEVCEHDLRVLKAVRESGVPLSDGEGIIIKAQEDFLLQAKGAAKPPGVEPKVQRPMERLVETRLRDAKEKTNPTAKPGASLPSDGGQPAKRTVKLEIMWGGYYICRERESGQFRVFRLLDFYEVDHHMALFREKFPAAPSLAEVTALKPSVWHLPLDTRALLDPPVQLIGARPLERADLEGYMVYLEHHGTSSAERAALETRLIGFSHEPPLRIELPVVEDRPGAGTDSREN